MGKSNFHQRIVETYLDEFRDEAYFNFSFEGRRFTSGSRSYDSEPKQKTTFIFEQDGVEVHFIESDSYYRRKFFNSPTLDKKFSQARFIMISEQCKPKKDQNSEEIWVTFEGYEKMYAAIHKNSLYLKKFSHNHKKGKIVNLDKKYW